MLILLSPGFQLRLRLVRPEPTGRLPARRAYSSEREESLQLGEQKRRYPAHFVSKLTDADAEQTETQHWLDTAKACEYISVQNHKNLMNECLEIGRMLGTMINKPDAFSRNF